MKLEEALHKLCTMVGQITITAGEHRYREGMPPHYLWEVIGSHGNGECYPAFAQADDLCVAIEKVITQLDERRTAAQAFIEANPELKSLPKSDHPTLIQEDPTVETVERAAVQYEGVTYSVPRPGRHDAVCRLMHEQGLESETMRLQGFVTSTGRFVDRREAAIIARQADQLIRKTFPTDLLFSEDVW